MPFPKQDPSGKFNSCAQFRSAAHYSRRSVLQAGLIGGLSLPAIMSSPLSAESGASLPGFGKAKRCIFLFMWGGPSHIDTLDPKPNAPAEVRGEFAAIDTNVPGIQLSEHFRMTAQQCDKLAVVRSLTHSDPSHLASGHCSLTGHLAPVPKSDAEPPSDRDSPHIGSVISKLNGQTSAMPNFVTLPWKAYHPAAPGGQAPGQTGGWLGRQYDPLMITGNPADPNWKVPALNLIDGVDTKRLNHRRSLLESIDRQRLSLDEDADVRSVTRQQERAFGLLTSPEVRKAFDLSEESDEVRDRYGRNTHGQCVLMARRLVESGVSLVSVNWHNDGQNFWDTHGNNFPRLKNDLIPPADRALATLLADLEERGLLDETLVCWVGEFGRKPQIGNGGREHYPQCYSGLFAGGGTIGGQIYGSSDAQGTQPSLNPVSPQDYAATVYHSLGVPHDLVLKDPANRPHPIYGGQPITDIFRVS